MIKDDAIEDFDEILDEEEQDDFYKEFMENRAALNRVKKSLGWC